jgi:perosamine synthetase
VLLGAESALAVSNGTAALHLALVALGIGPGDEVIVPDLTFAASANAVLYVGATPVLVDVRRDTWTVDLGAVERAITPRTRALMPVHLYGQPCEMDGLMALARARNLVVVEDAAEALGAVYQGWSVGQLGAAAAFSFFGNKLITTGEGGAVVVRDGAVAERARILRDHGMSPHRRYWHDEVGFNYRLTNLQAAVGLAQLERVEEFIARKVALAARYGRALGGRDDLVLPAVRPDTRNVFWLYSVVLDPTRARVGRDELMQRLLLGGIEARPLFYPLHEMPPYRRFAREARYANTEWLSANGLSLPSAVTLKDQEVDYVVEAVNRILDVRRIGELAENGS